MNQRPTSSSTTLLAAGDKPTTDGSSVSSGRQPAKQQPDAGSKGSNPRNPTQPQQRSDHRSKRAGKDATSPAPRRPATPAASLPAQEGRAHRGPRHNTPGPTPYTCGRVKERRPSRRRRSSRPSLPSTKRCWSTMPSTRRLLSIRPSSRTSMLRKPTRPLQYRVGTSRASPSPLVQCLQISLRTPNGTSTQV
jgi:hypothetical protein